MVTFADIQAAAATLDGHVLRTPAISAPSLSAMVGADVVLKLESQQVTGSFKARGALVRMNALTADERKAGVVAASAGNHAQGVGYHARELGIPATIYMPAHTPFTKVARTEALGAKVVLAGETVAESREIAADATTKDARVFIHPYDDPLIIAGQGTAAMELLQDHPDLDAILIAVGGGGFAAGTCIAAAAMAPGLEVLGIQSDAYPSMQQAFAGEPPHGSGATIADGIAVKEPGVLTTPILLAHMPAIELVGEHDIERAIQVFLDAQRLVVEGAGAVPLAYLLHNSDRFRGKKVGVMVCGGNIDSRVLSQVLMRGLVHEGRLAKLRISLVDRPGALADVSRIIGDHGGNIFDVLHQRMFRDVPIKQTDVDIAIETLDVAHVMEIKEALEKDGFGVRLLSETSLT